MFLVCIYHYGTLRTFQTFGLNEEANKRVSKTYFKHEYLNDLTERYDDTDDDDESDKHS